MLAKSQNKKHLKIQYFLRKIEDPTIFSSFPSEQREKRQKQPFRATPDPVCKIGHVRVYFAKKGCKIEDGFTDIFFGVQVRCLVLDWTGRLGLTFTTGLFIKFAAKRENGCSHFAMAQPSSFLPFKINTEYN